MTQFERVVNGPVPDDLLALDDAAEEFSLSRSTLYRLLTKSATPRYKRAGDRRTYVSRAQIEQLIGFEER